MAKQRSSLTIDDVVGAWAILPTPAKAGASDWRAEDTVDIDETVRIVEELIASGVNGILSLGTFGECATLLPEEKSAFLGAVIEAVRGRVPFFTGSTALSTRQVVRDTRMAHDMGADGTMLGVPMWCAPSEDMVVQYYKDVAEACPEMAICVYANPEAFKFEFGRSFWRRVSDIDQVITAKYVSVGNILTDMALSRQRIRFMPLDGFYINCARIAPDFFKAFWTGGAICGPEVVIKLRDDVAEAVRTGDWSAAERLSGRIDASYGPLFPNGSFRDFSTYNIILEKERMNAAGWAHVGPARAPYHIAPEAYLENARLSGRMWAELCAEIREAK